MTTSYTMSCQEIFAGAVRARAVKELLPRYPNPEAAPDYNAVAFSLADGVRIMITENNMEVFLLYDDASSLGRTATVSVRTRDFRIPTTGVSFHCARAKRAIHSAECFDIRAEEIYGDFWKECLTACTKSKLVSACNV